jgi:hypothetical protein
VRVAGELAVRDVLVTELAKGSVNSEVKSVNKAAIPQ